MKRIMLIVSYNGANYCGWQKQNNAISIEEVINTKLKELLKEDICVIGASRTDAGVHAKGNVAVFDTETTIPPEKIAYALNARLPQDIRIQESREVRADFHPRYDKNNKKYSYRILNTKINVPIYNEYTMHASNYLDIELMKNAAQYIVGEHDFKSFCAANTGVKTTVREVYSLEITKNNNDIITIEITGNGFLYNMVRIIVGTLIQVGTGKIKPEYVAEIIAAKDRSKAGPTAKAKGLTLEEIYY
ncbi:MAG: tRNA pseudouridine(38-40) synthase TruA [Lachnospiraceae bacterium]|nr:tRNA pseudouridine(38-40) synthase TruA [Lachnospiraceae bacterium]